MSEYEPGDWGKSNERLQGNSGSSDCSDKEGCVMEAADTTRNKRH